MASTFCDGDNIFPWEIWDLKLLNFETTFCFFLAIYVPSSVFRKRCLHAILSMFLSPARFPLLDSCSAWCFFFKNSWWLSLQWLWSCVMAKCWCHCYVLSLVLHVALIQDGVSCGTNLGHDKPCTLFQCDKICSLVLNAIRLSLSTWFILTLGSLSTRCFWGTDRNWNWTFLTPGQWSLPDFQTDCHCEWMIVNNVNLVVWRQVKQENSWVPVAVRGSKTSCAEAPH